MDANEINENSEIGRLGGVKALLKQINNKYSDSHVQLPDGTVPNPKTKPQIAKSKKKGAENDLKSSENNLENNSNEAAADGNGVKAMLKEINSKFSNSFVQLPDGSIPTKQAAVPKASTSGQDEEDIATEIPHIQVDPVSIPENLADELQVSYSNSEPSKTMLDDMNVMSDYPTNSNLSSASTQPSYVGEPPKLLSDYPEPQPHSFRVQMQVRQTPVMPPHPHVNIVPRSNYHLSHGNPSMPNGYAGQSAGAQVPVSLPRAQVPTSSLRVQSAHDVPFDVVKRSSTSNGISQGHPSQIHKSQGHSSQHATQSQQTMNRSAYPRIQQGDHSSIGNNSCFIMQRLIELCFRNVGTLSGTQQSISKRQCAFRLRVYREWNRKLDESSTRSTRFFPRLRNSKVFGCFHSIHSPLTFPPRMRTDPRYEQYNAMPNPAMPNPAMPNPVPNAKMATAAMPTSALPPMKVAAPMMKVGC